MMTHLLEIQISPLLNPGRLSSKHQEAVTPSEIGKE